MDPETSSEVTGQRHPELVSGSIYAQETVNPPPQAGEGINKLPPPLAGEAGWGLTAAELGLQAPSCRSYFLLLAHIFMLLSQLSNLLSALRIIVGSFFAI